MKTSDELREERATIVNEARKTWAEAEKRDGGVTEEDKAAFDKAMDAADKLVEDFERIERSERHVEDIDAPQERSGKPAGSRPRGDSGERRNAGAAVKEYRHWLETGEIQANFRNEQRRNPETRDTVIGTAAKGGYLVTPVEISDDLTKQMNDNVFMRRLAKITYVTSAQKLGIRQLTTRMSDANWTTEVGSVTEDTTQAFGRRDLEPQLLTKLSLVSIRTLLLVPDAESEVTDELAYKFSITQEKGFLTGSGSSQPLGVFTASSSGISTGRDVTAASSTAVVADDLINVKFSLKQQYLQDPSAGWIVHRDLVKMVRKLKDSYGQYIWQVGLQNGAPDMILDLPYYMSEYAPNTFTTGLYTAVIGNFKYYRIAQVKDLMIQRLVERYADTNQIGFIGRIWVDGSPVLEEAFGRLKLA